MSGLIWFFENLGLGVYNLFYAITHPASWLDWSQNESMMRFIYYGGSVEFFFVLLVILLPFSAYAAQRWANKTYQEAVKMNKKLDKIAALIEMKDEYPLPNIDPHK